MTQPLSLLRSKISKHTGGANLPVETLQCNTYLVALRDWNFFANISLRSKISKCQEKEEPSSSQARPHVILQGTQKSEEK